MAKFTVEFDTVDKTATFAIDGTPLTDVSSVNLYHRYSEDEQELFEISVYTETKKNPQTGMRERTYLYASESQEAAKAAETKEVTESAFAGFVQTTQKGTLADDVSAYFRK